MQNLTDLQIWSIKTYDEFERPSNQIKSRMGLESDNYAWQSNKSFPIVCGHDRTY